MRSAKSLRRRGRAGAVWSRWVVAEVLAQLLHSHARVLVRRDAGAGAPAGVKDGLVITSTELPSDGRQRLAGQLACKVHGELPGPCDAACARGREELVGREAEMLPDGRLDPVDRMNA